MSKLPKGMVRKRNSYFQRIRTTEGGKRHEKTAPLGSDYGLALAKRKRLLEGLERYGDHPTVEQFSELWLSDYVTPKRTDKGARLAEQRLRDFVLPKLGKFFIGQVTEAHAMSLRAFVEQTHDRRLRSGRTVRKKLSPTTVRHVMSEARCLFSFAVKARLIALNPIREDAFPFIQEEIPNPLSDVELHRVLEYCPAANRPLVGLALWTGLRYSELRGLLWSNVDLEGDAYLSVVRTGHANWTKSRRTRRVPLLPEAVRILTSLPRSSEWIFTGRFAGMISATPGPFNRAIALKVPGYTFHRLRHTMASRFLRAGGLMATLQRILGHASIKTSERYAKLMPDEVSAQARMLPLDWMPAIVEGDRGGSKGGTLVEELEKAMS